MGIADLAGRCADLRLGSGIAGIRRRACRKSTSSPNLGTESYIIDSLQVGVLGGVGNTCGTLGRRFTLGIAKQVPGAGGGAVLGKIAISSC